MSIVICVIDNNRELYFASDLRGEKEGVFTDDYNKIFEIRDSLYIGFTGALEPCLTFFNYLKDVHKNATVSALIKIMDSEFAEGIRLCHCKVACTATLAGYDENHNLFFFAQESNGKSEYRIGNSGGILYSISGSGELSVNEELESKINVAQGKSKNQGRFLNAIEDTILFASTINKTISPKSSVTRIS